MPVTKRVMKQQVIETHSRLGKAIDANPSKQVRQGHDGSEDVNHKQKDTKSEYYCTHSRVFDRAGRLEPANIA